MLGVYVGVGELTSDQPVSGDGDAAGGGYRSGGDRIMQKTESVSESMRG